MTCKNRMKGVLLFLFLIWGVVEQVYPQQALQSPDGKYNFVFEQKDGRLTYHLDYANKQVIEEGGTGCEYRQPSGGVGDGHPSR